MNKREPSWLSAIKELTQIAKSLKATGDRRGLEQTATWNGIEAAQQLLRWRLSGSQDSQVYCRAEVLQSTPSLRSLFGYSSDGCLELRINFTKEDASKCLELLEQFPERPNQQTRVLPNHHHAEWQEVLADLREERNK